MSVWVVVAELVEAGKIGPSDLSFVRALVADLRQVGGGKDLTPDQVRALVATTLPILELIAVTAFPALKPAEAVANVLMGMSRRPTFEEEQAMMNRDTAPGGRGM